MFINSIQAVSLLEKGKLKRLKRQKTEEKIAQGETKTKKQENDSYADMCKKNEDAAFIYFYKHHLLEWDDLP